MSTKNTSKINRLLQSQPSGIVLQASWLLKEGYSRDLQQRYKKNDWLQSIGSGAMIRAGDHVGYEGAIYSLQKQSLFTIHPGGRTALGLLGKGHSLEFAIKKVILFGATNEKLPSWFRAYNWGATVEYYQTSFLPPQIGLTELDLTNFSIKLSGTVRAMMECLYLSPEKQELIECFQIMEGLNNLPPKQVQELLENCQSVKVKRLFLYMAEKSKHAWFQYLDINRVNLGHGKRSLVKGGAYIDKYHITVPKELENYEERL